MTAISHPMRRAAPLLATVLLLFAAAMPGPARAGVVNLNSDGVAVQGYDVVAYFDQSRAVEGKAEFTAEYDGATYRFASAAHRDAFMAEPAKYAPAYGGYCAYAMAVGEKAPVDPMSFTVVDGSLYLNYSSGVQATWREDIAGYIRSADEHWKSVGAQ